MKNYLGLSLLLACLLVGGWVRWQMAAHDPLWIDELHTSWVLVGDWGDVTPRAIAGNQSPLYFWLSYPLVNSLGQSLLSLRALSLAAACGVLGLGAWIVLRMTRSAWAACATALVLALDSRLVFYASEARPYALVQLGGLLLTWLAYQRLSSSTMGLGGSLYCVAFVLVLVHPTAVLLTLTLALLLLLFRRVAAPWEGVGLAAASFFGVVLNPATSTWLTRRDLWQGLVDLPELVGLTAGLLLGAWVVPQLLRWWFFTAPPRQREPVLGLDFANATIPSPAAFWLGCFLGPTVVALLLSVLGIAGIATPRYLAAVWSFPALGLGFQIAGLPWRRGLAIGCLGVFLLLFGLFPIPQANAWRFVRTNPLAVSIWRERALPGMRSEGWQDIQKYLIAEPEVGQSTLWLYPNLIEDDLWERSEGTDERLNDYLCFPLRGLYDVPAKKIEPRAFRAEQLLEAADLKHLRDRLVWVVVRCALADVSDLQATWEADWQRLGGELMELRIELRLSAGDVHLLTLDASPQPSGAEEAK